MNTIVERIEQTYAQLNKHTVGSDLLEKLYAEDIEFVDPLHKIQSINHLKTYFENLYKNVNEIHFDFETTMHNDDTAFLSWTMTFSHPKLSNGEPIKVPGTTFIRHNGEKVTFHHDYFDSTHMIFDHIPVLKSIIKTIKNRLN